MDSAREIAEQLYQAEKGATPVDPLTVANPGLTAEQAYAIQLAGVAIRRERDSRKVAAIGPLKSTASIRQIYSWSLDAGKW
ncbi:MAG: hypothetical protein ABSE08_20480 [Syntrophobacteraceae bacterium]|jgi:2-keto-4-pentenoate hydratase